MPTTLTAEQLRAEIVTLLAETTIPYEADDRSPYSYGACFQEGPHLSLWIHTYLARAAPERIAMGVSFLTRNPTSQDDRPVPHREILISTCAEELKTQSWNGRIAALQALSRIPGEEPEALIRSHSTDDPSKYVKREALRLLKDREKPHVNRVDLRSICEFLVLKSSAGEVVERATLGNPEMLLYFLYWTPKGQAPDLQLALAEAS
ncbi:MAG: hypothetical protein HOJ15_01000 [Candidatus Jacksonbacteria bacterium]|jgi:hypothetical protein|nr:hypothetical protein [Candidatus Jacksonbacteria bacterium]MBT6034549.1 hypothetical protein [Candidatus Jacksonbacteria bacterium]MBT6300991.1 hypothetical protein [Candidatus Jacksonbacteria bacterium]MBT6756909.1 hypothetical protein [Candidatus Jacksonbacteria bacterium]MBT6955447.1 hypothetical protein [Candidatus Jacksonbacteria bacterium]